MRTLLLVLLLTTAASAQDPGKYGYKGVWDDTGNRTAGPMAAGVEYFGKNKWQVKFTGVFQNVPFAEVITFTGQHDKLSGNARVSGAKYTWSARVTDTEFVGSFQSNRGHLGTWTMKRVKIE